MPTKNNINGIHAQRLKQIRGFVNFDFDLRKPLSKYQKSKIKTYYDEINALTARPYQVYRPRNAEHLAKAQQFAQHEKRLPGLKVAFMPTDGKKVRVRFSSSGEISISSDHVTTRVIALDTDKLLRDPIGHVEARIKNRIEDSYTVLAGRYEIPVGLTKATLPRYVANLTSKYSSEDANNYFGNWLHGVAAHHFTEQAEFGEYLSAKSKAKDKVKRERRAKRQREYRKKLKR
jgi:hypothetical protein